MQADNPSPQIVRSSLAGILTDAVNIGTELKRNLKRSDIIARGYVVDNIQKWMVRISFDCVRGITHTNNITPHPPTYTYAHALISTSTPK